MQSNIEENIIVKSEEENKVVETNVVQNKIVETNVVENKYNFNIISTFLDGEQDIFDITLNSDDVKNEATFLSTC